ncbi:hypothetical protein ACWDBC_26150 [Streptomyces parvus]|uniref:hypothetical protein n=1 Tax=Streptomyces parvus TaxID=66428 RepID=UPI0033178460
MDLKSLRGNLRVRGDVGTPLVDGRVRAVDARLAFTYRAKNANLVLAGTGKVTVLVNGEVARTINVTGSSAPYRLTDDEDARAARLELRVDEGLQAYAFTFG